VSIVVFADVKGRGQTTLIGDRAGAAATIQRRAAAEQQLDRHRPALRGQRSEPRIAGQIAAQQRHRAVVVVAEVEAQRAYRRGSAARNFSGEIPCAIVGNDRIAQQSNRRTWPFCTHQQSIRIGCAQIVTYRAVDEFESTVQTGGNKVYASGNIDRPIVRYR